MFEMPSHPIRVAISKKTKAISIGEDVWKEESSFTAVGM